MTWWSATATAWSWCRARIDEVIQALAGIREAETALEAKVKAGLTVPDFVQDLLGSGRVRRLD